LFKLLALWSFFAGANERRAAFGLRFTLSERMGHPLNFRLSMLRLLPLVVIALALSGAHAGAQIQLTAPPAEEQTWTAQLAQPGNEQQIGATPAPRNAPPPIQESAPKPAPPDFSIVDRATGVKAAPLLEGWAKELNDIEQTLNAAIVSYGSLDGARGRLEEIRGEINEFLAILSPKVAGAKAQVENLGPVPEAGDPEPVAAQRAELQKVFGSLSAVRNIAESTKLRASQLTAKVQEIRRQKFTERLFEHVPEAHSAYTWQSAPQQFGFALQKAWQTISAWWEHLDRRSDAVQILIVGFLIAVLTAFGSARGVRHFRRWTQPGEPPFWRRSTSAAWVMLLRVVPYAATATFLYYSFRYQGLMTEDVDLLAGSAMRSLLIVTAVCALVATALAPVQAHWRLLPMDDRAARNIRWLVVALSAVYSFTLFLDTVRYVSNAPFTLTVAQSFVSSLVVAGLVVAILLTPRNPSVVQDAPEFRWIGKLRWPLWGVALIILFTALTGYIGLARFISAQLKVTRTKVAVL
jgi:small-conductance mechanosensitive channel